MKLEFQSTKPTFEPKTLSITFESEEELVAFTEMCGLNSTVSEAVKRKHSSVNRDVLSDMLGRIYLTLI